MERKIVKELERWRLQTKRKPLLLSGARQVGKTYSVLDFGRTHYRNTLYISMEGPREFRAVFDRDFDPDRIVRELAVLAGETVMVADTLIVFDEVQAEPRALTSLKYFAEGRTPYHVIATGSLLGTSVRASEPTASFPVGKVDMLTMHPMDFEEFCWAAGETALIDAIRQAASDNTATPVHEKALDMYRRHLAVGGMPEAVDAFVAQDLTAVSAAQNTLNQAATADMTKYTAPVEAARIIAAWASLPSQLAKENRRFQYALVRPGARASQYEWAVQWLISAGLVIPVTMVGTGRVPLAVHAEPGAFKLYMYDTGLLTARVETSLERLIQSTTTVGGFAGALTENYVAQAMAANGVTLYSWASPGKAEVDFVYQTRDGDVVPIEVKAADNVRSKSLSRFIELYSPPQAVRLTTKQFGVDGAVRSVPLYGAWLLGA